MHPHTGYIDLSKRRVSPEDIVKCEERFNKSKMVASIMRHVAEKTNTPMETLYQEIGWPLNKKYGHAVDAFKLSITQVRPLGPWFEPSMANTAIETLMFGTKSHSPTTLSRKRSNPTLANVSPLNQPKSAPMSK